MKFARVFQILAAPRGASAATVAAPAACIATLATRVATRMALASVVALALTLPHPALAQGLPGTENGEWRYLGGDAGNSRSNPDL
ncbi:MAG: hypothetical protein R3223_07215, partial [Longimicrobiales bacterium]|nr:hypothetical protein [Longimicrobiales bacterium]